MTDEELKELVASNARAIAELRLSIHALGNELKESTGDLRASLSSLRDIIVGHERRIIRLEGREIDLWGDYISMDERLRALEAWKAKFEGEQNSSQS